MKNRLAAASLVVGLVAGGVAGLALGITGLAGADTSPTTTTPPATSTSPAAPAPGTFHSNEATAHETGESAAQEQAENSGQLHGGGGHPNEGAAHEATESTAREAQENSGAAPAPATPGV